MNELAIKDKMDETPARLLTLAIEKGASIEMMEKLLTLQERHEANEARKAYHVAMAAFKANPPTIIKNKVVDFKTEKGRTSYKHADLAEAAALIGQALSKHGLSAAWRTEQAGSAITVICEITHILGHSEKTSLTAPPDNSGSKNAIQAVASTVSYLQRYTLLALTGLAAQDQDDDGVKAGGEPAKITAEQFAKLNELIKITGTDMAKFLVYFKVESIEVLPAGEYKRALALVEAKMQGKVVK